MSVSKLAVSRLQIMISVGRFRFSVWCWTVFTSGIYGFWHRSAANVKNTENHGKRQHSRQKTKIHVSV